MKTTIEINSFLLAQASKGGNIFKQGIESAQDQKDTWTEIWQGTLGAGGSDVFGGGQLLYTVMVKMGLTAGAFVLSFLALALLRSWMEGKDFEAYLNLLISALVIILLSGNGKLLANYSFALRELIYSFNRDVATYAVMGVNLEEAYKAEQYKQGLRQIATQHFRQCESMVGEAQKQCLTTAVNYIEYEANKILEANSWSIWFKSVINNTLSSMLPLATGAAVGLVGGPAGALVGAGVGLLISNWESIIFSLLNMWGQGYQHALEISLLLTANVAPIPVALSLMPWGTKPLFLWLFSFVTVGFNKICFTYISGLAAYFAASSSNLDPMPMAFVFGFFAPVLSSGLALFGGMAIWRGLTSAMKETTETVAKMFI